MATTSVENARSRVRSAVARGQLDKPDDCGQCGAVPQNKNGLVAIFPRGPERWEEPDWICRTCQERFLEIKRGGKRQIQRKYPTFPLTYEQIKAHLFEDNMTYKQIYEKYNLSSLAMLHKRFKTEAVKRGEWPFEVLTTRYAQARKDMKAERLTTKQIKIAAPFSPPPTNSSLIRLVGFAHDLREFTTLINMTPAQFDRETGMRHDTAASIIRGEKLYASAKNFAKLDRTLKRLRRQYRDYETRAAWTRKEMNKALRDGTRGGTAGLGKIVGSGYQQLDRYLAGGYIDPYLFLRVEEQALRWSDVDAEISDLRMRMRRRLKHPLADGGRWPTRSRVLLAKTAGVSVHVIEAFDYGRPVHQHLRAIREVIEKWEADDGVLR